MPGDNPKPTSDLIFRKLFGSEENKDLLISLINSIVEPRIRVTDVEIKNPFNLAAYQGSKESIVDIKARDRKGTWYTIEMQMHGHVFYDKRALYYAARAFVDQLGTARDFPSLSATVGIHLLGFDLFDDDQMVHHFEYRNVETSGEPEEPSHLQVYYVEMGKFHKHWDEMSSIRHLWVAFMTQGQDLNRGDLPAPLQAEPVVARAVAQLERMAADPTIREIYEAEEKAKMVEAAQLAWADKQGQEKGREEGIVQGIPRGQQRLLLRLMSRRFGQVPLQIEDRLHRLTPDQLDELGEALFDLHTYAEVEAWLSRC